MSSLDSPPANSQTSNASETKKMGWFAFTFQILATPILTAIVSGWLVLDRAQKYEFQKLAMQQKFDEEQLARQDKFDNKRLQRQHEFEDKHLTLLQKFEADRFLTQLEENERSSEKERKNDLLDKKAKLQEEALTLLSEFSDLRLRSTWGAVSNLIKLAYSPKDSSLGAKLSEDITRNNDLVAQKYISLDAKLRVCTVYFGEEVDLAINDLLNYLKDNRSADIMPLILYINSIKNELPSDQIDLITQMRDKYTNLKDVNDFSRLRNTLIKSITTEMNNYLIDNLNNIKNEQPQ